MDLSRKLKEIKITLYIQVYRMCVGGDIKVVNHANLGVICSRIQFLPGVAGIINLPVLT